MGGGGAAGVEEVAGGYGRGDDQAAGDQGAPGASQFHEKAEGRRAAQAPYGADAAPDDSSPQHDEQRQQCDPAPSIGDLSQLIELLRTAGAEVAYRGAGWG